MLVAASVLASDFSCLAQEGKRMLQAGADWLHLDIMDGHFVPNISFGAPVVKSLRNHIPKKEAYFDCHFMVSCPSQWISSFEQAGADQITFHFESLQNDCTQAIELAKCIIDKNMHAGLSLCPESSLESCLPALQSGKKSTRLFHTLLIMTVKPGFGGQKFMSDMISKIQKARHLFPDLIIQVDGGITVDTAKICREAGANCFVAGTALYLAENPSWTIQKFRQS